MSCRVFPRRASSIRTRIKTFKDSSIYLVLAILAEHLPLEQGLRPTVFRIIIYYITLAEHLPLEQGLRLLQKVVKH